MELKPEVKENRRPDHDIHPLFLNRWSPRAMSGEEVHEDQAMQLFEAARWAPSSRNEQPWRFIYSLKGDERWDDFLSLLVEGNRVWCEKAGMLICIVSKRTFTKSGKDNRTHSFTTGSAFENLLLQGTTMGLVCHGLGGFDYDTAREVLHVPEDYEVCAMLAVGKPGSPEDLPDGLREREVPSGRKPTGEIIMKGKFKNG